MDAAGWTAALVEQISIPQADASERGAFARLADEILRAKAADPNADVGELEREADRLIYALYGLTPDETAAVERAVGAAPNPLRLIGARRHFSYMRAKRHANAYKCMLLAYTGIQRYAKIAERQGGVAMLDTQKRNISPNDLREMDPSDRMKLGQAMYREDILPRMTDDDKGMMVALDIASGDYEMDIRSADAGSRLRSRRPDAITHIERVGSPTPFKAISLRPARRPRDD